MKKTISIIMLLVMMFSIVSCSGSNPLDPVTLKLEDTQKCKDCSIKFSSSTDILILFQVAKYQVITTNF